MEALVLAFNQVTENNLVGENWKRVTDIVSTPIPLILLLFFSTIILTNFFGHLH